MAALEFVALPVRVRIPIGTPFGLILLLESWVLGENFNLATRFCLVE